MDINTFKAGIGKIDITPPLGTLINGDFITHYAHSIHDPLYSKALILENQQTTIVIVVVDICAMRKEFIDEVKDIIQQQINVNPNNILISATHTHAAGAIESLLLGAADITYRYQVKKGIIQSVLKAKKNVRPAKIGFGKVAVPEHVVCRRYLMKEGYKAYNPVSDGFDKVKTNPMGDEDKIEKRNGVVDPEVCYLAIQDKNGEWIGMLANYSMHYVGDWNNGTITSDYFGVFAWQIKVGLQASDDFEAIMTNGTSGDANIVDFIQPNRYPKGKFVKSKLIGNDIAERVINSLQKLQWETNPALNVIFKLLEVNVRKPSSVELTEAKKIVENTRYEYLTFKESSDTGTSHTGNEIIFRQVYAREQILLNEYPDTILFPIQVIKIGSVVIGGLGGEFFADTGLKLKNGSKVKNYFTIGLANDYVGYVPPKYEFALGGYETWRCRSSFLNENAEEAIRQELLNLINR